MIFSFQRNNNLFFYFNIKVINIPIYLFTEMNNCFIYLGFTVQRLQGILNFDFDVQIEIEGTVKNSCMK